MTTVPSDATQASGPDYGNSTFEQVFGDTTRSRVIRYLAEHPNESHMQVSVAESVGASQPMVSRAIAPLDDAGLVEKGEQGVTLKDTPRAEALIVLVSKLQDDSTRA